jgi:hypothetical protein
MNSGDPITGRDRCFAMEAGIAMIYPAKCMTAQTARSDHTGATPRGNAAMTPQTSANP